jgi:nitrite reductase (NADH) small subunit
MPFFPLRRTHEEQMMAQYRVPEANNLKPGEKVIVKIEAREIGIFNIQGKFHAIRNTCPDQSGPLCQGDIFDRVEADVTADRQIREYIKEEKTVIACPWHGWEYDINTGECLWNPRYRVRVYQVDVLEDGVVTVSL